ncbi:MAG TPA: hypothetical protein VKO63_13010 [Chitinispirillaceae bacterium]|nr:hypothetical protein [Chitinispirillaceae bacterium]
MKKYFFDIAILLMMIVAIGVKTDLLKGAEQPDRMWTLEEASFLKGSTMPQSVDRSLMQAVTRQNEGAEWIFKCAMHQND